MSVLDRIPVGTRRSTGWLVPMAVSTAIGVFAPQAERVVGQSERLWTSGMLVAGCVAGVLWQWYSPRPLAERLFVPALGVMAFALVFLLPGDWSSRGPDGAFGFPIGVVAGLVLRTWQQGDSADDDEIPGDATQVTDQVTNHVKEERSPGI